MSDKNLTGQMNMFDLYDDENKNKVVVTPGKLGKRKTFPEVVMTREINDSAGRVVKSVSYINYNKVKIITNYDEEKLYEFESAKEAVDFYVEKMQNLKKL